MERTKARDPRHHLHYPAPQLPLHVSSKGNLNIHIQTIIYRNPISTQTHIIVLIKIGVWDETPSAYIRLKPF
ncbi:hypothetical protein X975_19428, partial [Stegodyphus mimosarum]